MAEDSEVRELTEAEADAFAQRPRNYEVGDWFAAPVGGNRQLQIPSASDQDEPSTLAHGTDRWLVARVAAHRNDQVFVYAYADTYPKLPSLAELATLRPEQAEEHLDGDDLFLRGELWTVLGHDDDFDPERWPLVERVRTMHTPKGPVHLAARPAYYSDEPVTQRRVSADEAATMSRDTYAPAVAFHLSLQRLATTGTKLGLSKTYAERKAKD